MNFDLSQKDRKTNIYYVKTPRSFFLCAFFKCNILVLLFISPIHTLIV